MPNDQSKGPDFTVLTSVVHVLPAQLIQLYDQKEWEMFVNEWTDGFEPRYAHVDCLGGPGDKGRDVVGYTDEPSTNCAMDLYQCKHYAQPLKPSDIWVELGKLCVFTWRGEYRIPRKYWFVAPRGVSTKVADLLSKPEDIRSGLISNWDSCCKKKITKRAEIPLTGELLSYVQRFNFSIVGYAPVKGILEQHARTRHWHQRFKRDYPARPGPAAPPSEIEGRELPYVSKLLAAYGEYLGEELRGVEDLPPHADVNDHFIQSRRDFFRADGLNRFYRDQFSIGAFEDVKRQVYDGVIDVVNSDHKDGYQRVLATTKQSVIIQLAGSEYSTYVEPSDKKGICHHLANDGKIHWVKK